MFGKKSFDVSPKVGVALQFFGELRNGTVHDGVYGRELRRFSVFEIPRDPDQPFVVGGYHRNGEVSTYRKPELELRHFLLDRISWFVDNVVDPEPADWSKYDGVSNWHIVLWCGHKNWLQAEQKGVLWVGVSHAHGIPASVNSFGLDFWDRGQHSGHNTIVFPKQREA